MRYKELLAYTAGIIDGEGHIVLSAQTHGVRYMVVEVAVTNTNEWLCQWLAMQFGGHVSSTGPVKEHWRKSFRWKLSGKKAKSFLIDVLPYLQLKRPQAELAIKFQQRRTPSKRNDTQKILDEADFILMRGMNKRGR